eukprot:TRINITY_DN7915_c0_g1_i5.p1 TRINITY_DN7915_c0_g1~~TRINITY_DN7915_c0_g1_i5.p1  ORF type:complete len:105 (+),score=16.31 TRINITY_DN7915_c0_g1_i5:327-641(+)
MLCRSHTDTNNLALYKQPSCTQGMRGHKNTSGEGRHLEVAQVMQHAGDLLERGQRQMNHHSLEGLCALLQPGGPPLKHLDTARVCVGMYLTCFDSSGVNLSLPS